MTGFHPDGMTFPFLSQRKTSGWELTLIMRNVPHPKADLLSSIKRGRSPMMDFLSGTSSMRGLLIAAGILIRTPRGLPFSSLLSGVTRRRFSAAWGIEMGLERAAG